jgi:hypothetical protein
VKQLYDFLLMLLAILCAKFIVKYLVVLGISDRFCDRKFLDSVTSCIAFLVSWSCGLLSWDLMAGSWAYCLGLVSPILHISFFISLLASDEKFRDSVSSRKSLEILFGVLVLELSVFVKVRRSHHWTVSLLRST